MKNTEQLCLDILTKIDIKYAKAYTNLVISLGSYEAAQSVTELSESPLFHHQYSSIRDGIAGVGTNDTEQKVAMNQVRQLGLAQVDFTNRERILLQTDASSIVKPHSACLEDRQYVKINNNVIQQNQPISVGYPISLVNISPGHGKWSIPIDIRRIPSSQSATACAVEQILELKNIPELSDLLIINTLDTGYGNAGYMSRVYAAQDLVNLVRFRYGKKVWTSWKEETEQEKEPDCKDLKQGAPRIYGNQFYLIDHSDTKIYKRKEKTYEVERTSIFDLPYQNYIELEGETSKGRQLNIQVWRWNDLLIRSKQGQDMKDKPFDLIASRVSDQETGKLVFQRTMFTVIHGQRKAEITTEQAFEGYRKRYDIEPSIKFAKQKLLLDKYQTSKQQHFDNWLVVVVMTYWLLFTAKDEVAYQPKKWRQYKERNKQTNEDKVTDKKTIAAEVILTPSQTKQAAEALFLTFDKQPFLPKVTKKGKGRLKGTKMTKRIRHPIVKKRQSKTKIKLTTEKIE